MKATFTRREVVKNLRRRAWASALSAAEYADTPSIVIHDLGRVSGIAVGLLWLDDGLTRSESWGACEMTGAAGVALFVAAVRGEKLRG